MRKANLLAKRDWSHCPWQRPARRWEYGVDAAVKIDIVGLGPEAVLEDGGDVGTFPSSSDA